MKRLTLLLASALLAFAASVPAQAISVPITVAFVLPTTGCTIINGTPVNPCDNVPLTGVNALTNTDIWISLAPIPNNFAGAPTLSIPAGSTSANTNFTASNGDTIYVRLKARTASNSSPAYSVEATRSVTVGAAPGNVTSVTVNINIS